MLPTIIRHNSPYADAPPPPPPVVMLLSATVLHLPAFQPLLSQEALTVTPAPMAADAKAAGKSVPPPSAAPSHERGDSPLTEMDDDESETGGSSDSDGGDATAPKIASPKGVTRLTLAKHKEWVHGHLTNEITSHVHQLARKFLDTSEVFTHQDRAALKDVYRRAKVAYPDLRKYDNNWPIKCILQAHLKITKTASKNAAFSNLGRVITGKDKKTKATKGRL
ncbi:hypothetical protein B0H13DRAFT_1910894 [Mycena leptocephala]|nr:hypothetical protein B0H13DRAFT_1910894 [Mycena leptocephala]